MNNITGQISQRIIAWLKTITFYEILVGMKGTLSHLLHYQPVTEQYPYEKRVLSENYRGMLALLRYDDGTEKCVGCDLCEAACPSRVIRVVSAEVPGEPTKRYSKEYYMDMTRCLFCGLCVDACPVDALGMTREFEWSVYNKRDLLLNKEQLLALGDRSFPVKEKRIEFQHLNVAVFNVGMHNHPPKDFPIGKEVKDTPGLSRRKDYSPGKVEDKAA
jgi:NADH-quinone oxidoreductase subunit I